MLHLPVIACYIKCLNLWKFPCLGVSNAHNKATWRMQLVSTILHAITDMLVILSKNVTKVSLISLQFYFSFCFYSVRSIFHVWPRHGSQVEVKRTSMLKTAAIQIFSSKYYWRVWLKCDSPCWLCSTQGSKILSLQVLSTRNSSIVFVHTLRCRPDAKWIYTTMFLWEQSLRSHATRIFRVIIKFWKTKSHRNIAATKFCTVLIF